MDYGMAVSQPGKDVKVTADRFFTLSSSFQSLKVLAVHEVTTTIPVSGTNVITITHNIGYFAPCLVVYNGSTTLGQGTSYLMSDSFSDLDIEIAVNTIKINVDDTFDNGNSAAGDTVYFTVYSFIDTFDTFVAPVLSTNTTDTADGNDYGFRISKPGFDVRTCADVDCIVTSKRPSMTVHMKGIADAGDTLAHGLGYVPTFLPFIRFDGDDFLSLRNYLFTVDETNVYFQGTGYTCYYVLFKSRNV